MKIKIVIDKNLGSISPDSFFEKFIFHAIKCYAVTLSLQKQEIIKMIIVKGGKIMNKNAKRIISVVSVIAIVLGGFGIYSTFSKDKIASIVLLDVNPSIELRVDEDADVIEVVALNTDAEKVLKGMKLKGTDADTAVNAIIGSLLKHGYVDELANSILLSVEDKDKVRGAELQRELTEEINEILSATAINAAILAQQVDGVQVKEMADELDISKGKAELIQNIMEVNSSYKAEDLAKLSVNELNLVLSNPKNEVKNVTSTGNANEKAYIGKEVAKKKAYEHAKVKAEDIREAEVDFDYEYGKMVYEVEFSRGEYEYDYSIDAQEGTVLYSHREVDEDYVKVQESSNDSQVKEEVPDKQTSSSETSNNETKPTDIGKEKAKSVALKHAKTTESKVTRLIVEREYDDGKLEYHVDFRLGNKEYDYEISAETGEILDYDIDVDEDKKVASSSNNTSTEPADIGKEKAKSVALSHAGLKESQVTRLKVERDVDDGRIEYSVEFMASNKEYDYEINGENGEILDYDIEVEDND